MAVINLAITIPDAQVTRVQEAIRGTFELPPTATNPELIEKLRQETLLMIKRMVLNWEKRLAVTNAENASYDVDAT